MLLMYIIILIYNNLTLPLCNLRVYWSVIYTTIILLMEYEQAMLLYVVIFTE